MDLLNMSLKAPYSSKIDIFLSKKELINSCIVFSLAPRYEFNLTKVKHSSLTIFIHKSSPLPVRNLTDQPNQREGHSKRLDFCKI